MNNMVRKFFLLFLLCSKHLLCSASVSITCEEAIKLESLFRCLLQHTETGYVLLGKKPTFISGYFPTQVFIFSEDFDQTNTAIAQGLPVWRKIASSQDRFFFESYEGKGGHYVLLIDKPHFLKVVTENIHLFQYILGYKFSPQKMLMEVEKNSACFLDLLNHNKVLSGIVLGYGTDSSLLGSRLEYLQEMFFEKPIPPFKSRSPQLFSSEQGGEAVLLFSSPDEFISGRSDETRLNRDTNQLKCEFEELMQEATLSTPTLAENLPYFICCQKKTDKSSDFLIELEKAQQEINKILDSPNFLERVLCLLGCELTIEPTVVNTSFSPNTKMLHKTIAKVLWNELESHSDTFFKEFVEWFHTKANLSLPPHPFVRQIAGYQNLLSVLDHIKESTEVFAKIETDSSYMPVKKDYLYIRTLKSGEGEACLNPKEVFLDYEVFSPTGRCLAIHRNDLNPQPISLDQTISSFAHGINGMKIGETREIFIHPALAYGVYTSLERGIYLRAVVTLKGVSEDNRPLPPLEFNDLSNILSPTFKRECEELYHQYARYLGNSYAHYFSKNPLIDLTEVKQELISHQKEKPPLEFSKDEIDLFVSTKVI